MNRSSIASPLNAVAHRTACLMHAWHGISAKTSLEIIQKGNDGLLSGARPCPSGVLSGCPFLRVLIIQLKSTHKSTPSTSCLFLLSMSFHRIPLLGWIYSRPPKKILAPELRAPTRTNAMPLTQGDAGIRNKSIIHAEARISAHGDQEWQW